MTQIVYDLTDYLVPTIALECYRSGDFNPSRAWKREETMTLSRRQEIYIEILNLLLPFVRNVQTWSRWQRLFYQSIYEETELAHNIPPLLVYQDFKNWDVYWINTQARNYVNACKKGRRVSDETIIKLINELLEMVPEELKPLLTWHGDNK